MIQLGDTFLGGRAVHGSEFEISPNRSFASAYDGTEPLSLGMLSRRLDTLRDEKARLQDDREAMQELLRIRQQLTTSRWVSLGTAIGLARTLRKNEGKSAAEKARKLKDACAASQWLKLGAALGSVSAKALQQR